MKPHQPEPANDRNDLTAEEHLRLCAETLFLRGLIKPRIYHQTITKIREQATRQRAIRARLASCQAADQMQASRRATPGLAVVSSFVSRPHVRKSA